MKKIEIVRRVKQYVKRSTATTKPLVDIVDDFFWELYEYCKRDTMTSVERMYGLYKAIDYVLINDIKGDFVECGVWRGGSAMLIGKMLAQRNILDRKIYLYDTFEGMSPPTANDIDLNGNDAAILLNKNLDNRSNSIWCEVDLEQVKQNMSSSGLSDAQIIYVQGKVENTIPQTIPQTIALLRLDTDWYESTKHELIHLYPKISLGGALIIDDYGHWQGCQKAVDEYFKTKRFPPLLSRLDYTGRMAIKYREEQC